MLLLDEPAAGLTDGEQTALAGNLRRLADGGLTIAVVEHGMHFLLPLADQVICLDRSRVIAVGTPAEVVATPAVIDSYLGREAEAAVADRRARHERSAALERGDRPASRQPPAGGARLGHAGGPCRCGPGRQWRRQGRAARRDRRAAAAQRRPIVLAGVDITDAPAHRRAWGSVLSRGRHLFPAMTVAETLAAASRSRPPRGASG